MLNQPLVMQDILDTPNEKIAYTDIEYQRLVQIAAVLDFKFKENIYNRKWFRSESLYLEEPFFSSIIHKKYLLRTAPKAFKRHNVFYDKYELEVL